jgi:hypothetical protein
LTRVASRFADAGGGTPWNRGCGQVRVLAIIGLAH